MAFVCLNVFMSFWAVALPDGKLNLKATWKEVFCMAKKIRKTRDSWSDSGSTNAVLVPP